MMTGMLRRVNWSIFVGGGYMDVGLAMEFWVIVGDVMMYFQSETDI